MVMAASDWHISQSDLLGFSHFLAPLYVVLFLVSITLNALLVVVTVKSPRLRSNCNILIAFQAFCDILASFCAPIYIYNTYANRLLSISDCFWYQVVPDAGGISTTVLILLIGTDRYLCIAYPLWYKRLNQLRYLSCYVAICLAYSVAFGLGMFFSQERITKVICFLPDAMTDSMKNILATIQAVVVILDFVVYFKLYRFPRKRGGGGDQETAKIVKALTVIVLVFSFGWCSAIVILGLSRILISDKYLTQAIGLIEGIFAFINVSAPSIVYYFHSSVYRKEFRLLLGMKANVSHVNHTGSS
ncbi:hypothetical protein QR680_011548 [Steinernema hermaphroditum]|uniref:G-protein coupled receptors family 1 profile domain-containing protein n=1 Tax=Steinernema hermaphroditum TaxID=289476 RepID=A0AA39I1G6_9BILA|nr:hypothetical protein QR680_011548 [Steinernema hermaphroditum]